jgi:aminopeptidase N
MKVLFFIMATCIGTNVAAQKKLTSGGKLKPEQAVMDIRHYTISLDVNIAAQRIQGSTVIDFVMTAPAKTLLFDLLDSFAISSVQVNGKAEAFTYKNDMITITLANELPAGKASVTVVYGGKPHVAIRPPWDDGFTWTKDAAGNPWMAVTAEGTGGKIFFPCKDHPSDEPDDGADMIITTDKKLVVAGPGLLQSTSTKGNKATYHWKTNYSINNYSIVFNIGKYKVVSRDYTTIAGNKVPMQFYVLEQDVSKAAYHLDVFEQTARIQEKYFGEYPFIKEKIGIVQTPHLGMEHQTMNAYGNNFRYEKVGGKDFDWLLHHEFGHEWWGNKVTVKDWADFWIQEGICSFGDALATRELAGEQAYLDGFKRSYFGIENKLPVVQGKDLDEEAAYIGDIYSKGAFFMHTLRFVIGDSIFFPTLKFLATDPAYTYNNLVTTADVQQLFSKKAGIDLQPLFKHCLYTTDKLEIQVKRTAMNVYAISLKNIDMQLPVEIVTDAGKKILKLSRKPITVRTKSLPIIDPEMYYMNRVTFE